MHIVFVHQNFPAQFGHIAQHLSSRHGDRCTFVSRRPPGRFGRIELLSYRLRGGARAVNHFCSRSFENQVWHTHAVYECLKARPDIRPDLIVGHSGFGSTLFLGELYPDVPIINYFEYFYHTRDSDMDFRPDFPPSELSRLRARARNAMILLDLDNCDRGYSPTHWQRDRLPVEYRPKVRVAFDGVDTEIWRPRPGSPRVVAGRSLPPDFKIVTYASRGMESMRGFDIFMKMAKRLGERHRDVLFVIAGEDRICYGGDGEATGSESFRDWVLARDTYDLSRFVFLGLVPRLELAKLFALSDLHVYLTVPFVLSWSLLDALACGAKVLASNTAPVREVIQHGRTGLLVDFFDIEAMCDVAGDVLDRPDDYRHLASGGVGLIQDCYSLEACLPVLRSLYLEEATKGTGADRRRGSLHLTVSPARS